MKKNIFLIFCLFFSILSINAQNSLSGKIVDENSKPIFFVTIALYNTDSTMVQTASTEDDGTFVLNDLKDGEYFLEATMIGYEKGIQTGLKIPNSDNAIIDLTLLDDVAIW